MPEAELTGWRILFSRLSPRIGVPCKLKQKVDGAKWPEANLNCHRREMFSEKSFPRKDSMRIFEQSKSEKTAAA
jgi:hypothetical protein